MRNNIHTTIKKNTILKYTGIVLIGLILYTSCNSPVKNNNTKKSAIPTEEKKDKISITYHQDSIPNDSALKIFKSKYSDAQLKIIAATNRIDVNRVRVKSKLVIPDTLLSDFMDYATFPETLNLPDSVPKFIMINQRVQLFGAYENGKLVRFGPVSSGRQAKPTPNGLFYTNYKSKLKISTVDGDWKMP